MLTALARDVWEIEYHAHGMGLHVRTRMTVLRLADGGLLLHSAIPIDDALGAELAGLGPVRHIVAPNRFHHLFAAAAKERYPDATLWAAPGLPEKRRDVRWDRELATAAPWSGELDVVLIDGAPMWSELVFFHRPSGTLLCSDLLFNITNEASGTTRLFYRAMGVWRRFGQSRPWRLLLKRRSRPVAAASLETLLSWPVQRIVMGHGDVVTTDAQRRLRDAFAWLLTAR